MSQTIAARIVSSLVLWRGLPAMRALIPGILICVVVAAAAVGMEYAEARAFGRVWLEALVLAILIATAVRSLWTQHRRWFPGINFSAKTLLEVAVMLLGVSVSVQTILHVGPRLPGRIVAVVAVSITAGYGMGRVLGLLRRMALPVAGGNSICGNSAIAEVAPVIGADSDDIVSSIAFTAVLGVLVVLGLPLLIPVLRLAGLQYRVLAGLTVCVAPQVFVLSLLTNRLREETEEPAPQVTARDRPAPNWLTIISMAALGLGVDAKVAAQAGEIGQRQLGRGDLGEHGFRFLPKGDTRVRQLDPAPDPMEQLDRVAGFQGGDRGARRRLGQIERARWLGPALTLRDGDEDT